MTNQSSRAYMYLIKLISARDYSEHKLREKLRTKKFSPEESEKAINEIKEKGFLKEEIYAEARVKAFMSKGYSPNYIRQKMAQEHLTVTEDEIVEVFSEHHTNTDEQIARLVRKKMGRKSEFTFEDESKILRFLLSKGHDFGTAKKVMKTMIAELKAEQNLG